MKLEHEEPHLTFKERRCKIEQIIQTGQQKDLEARNAQLKIWREILEQETNKLGIVCLSAKPNDILMWSHYSNKHRGYCLKFDKKILEKAFYCSPVNYNSLYPTFTAYIEEIVQRGSNELHKTFLLTKSVHWEYEEEYRLIVDPSSRKDLPGDRNYNYPEESLVAIIWGCQMTDRDKEKVQNVVGDRACPIFYFQAKKSKSAYKIEIEPA